jgi:hypothetical protein
MTNRPRLSRSGQTLDLSLPMAPWTPRDRGIGGGEKSAAGVPSNYTIRREPLLDLRLRVTEAEWPTLVGFLRAVDDAGIAWSLRPDRDVSTTLTVYLESPSVANDEEITAERDDGDPTVYVVAITVRPTTSTVPDVRLYGT